jgi:CMP-N,N'-diacetyllegionaminic acid synthase
MTSKKIIGEIPARLGSERVKRKNLRNLVDKPLIQYAIDSAKKSTLLTDFYVNTESKLIGNYALKQGVKFYERNKDLATNKAKQDEFNYDFIKNTKADILVLINPVAPLTTSDDIDGIIEEHLKSGNDVTVTSLKQHLHSFYNGDAVNFNTGKMLPRTQDITPIDTCTWAVCVWNAKLFVQQFDRYGYAVFFGKVGFYPLSFLKSIKISTEEDFRLAEKVISNKILQSIIS